MEFQAIDAQGPIHIERLEFLPEWTPEDMGRFIYVEEDKLSYYGTSEGWNRATGTGLRPVYVNKNYTASVQDLLLVDTRNRKHYCNFASFS